ncbi:hypothetical protein [Micromonospora violae]|uniref:hypothetical protein n=1 Tax=Micromonospora violae TaxID=1278207 RepID=UPI00102BFEEB|nr:hypothetical protein [Micromonospora violae]
MRDWISDVAVNVVANLVAAAVIWLLASATGYVKGNATLAAIATVIIVSALIIALSEFASGVHRRVEPGSLSSFRMNFLRSSPALLCYLTLAIGVPLIIWDIPRDMNLAWREIPSSLRTVLILVLVGTAYSVGFLRARILGRRSELEGEVPLPPLPMLLRVIPASLIVVAVGSTASIIRYGLH